MKTKVYIGIALAALLLACVFAFSHRQQIPAAVASSVTNTPVVSPAIGVPMPENPGKLKLVAMGPVNSLRVALRPPVSNLSQAQIITDTSARFEDRLLAVHALSTHMTGEAWLALKQFLLTPDAMDREQQNQVVKNELLDALCALDSPPDGLGGMLAKIYHDPEQNDVIRDYAVQHMAAYYEQASLQSDSAKELQSDQTVLWDAVSETRTSIGGTALLALKRLSQEYSGFDQDKISAAALQMAGDPSAGELSHVTAYQVCAQMGNANALPLLIQAVQNGDTIPVRISAVGALGTLGGPGQVAMLKDLLAGNEEWIKVPAQRALDQIGFRQNSLASQK